MEKIKFKTNIFEKIFPVLLVISGLFAIYTNGIVTRTGLLGMIAIITAFHIINSSEISSIKKYLNERRE